MSDLGVVEQPVAAEVATSEPATTAVEANTPSQGEPVDKPEVAPERTFTQKEVEKIAKTRSLQEARRAEKVTEARMRAEYAERELAQLKAPKASGAPQPEQFKDWNAFQQATIAYEVEQAIKADREKSQSETQRQHQEYTQRESVTFVNAQLEKAAEKFDDFNDVVVNADLPVSQAMTAYIVEAGDKAFDVAYDLCKNHPEEVKRIAKLSPAMQVRELTKLELKLGAAPATTKVPAPIVPNKGTNASLEKQLEDANYSDFVKLRQRQIAARKR